MARPPNADAAATRARLLEAAARCFAQRGLAGTTVRGIAGEAGLSVGLVRHYFGSKEKLYEACVAESYRIFEQLAGEMANAFVRGVRVEEVVAEATRRAFRFAWRHRESVRLTLIDQLHGGGGGGGRGEQLMLPFVRLMGGQLATKAGISQAEGVLALRTITLLVTRYATLAPGEIARLLEGGGVAEPSERRALGILEDHLVQVLVRLSRPEASDAREQARRRPPGAHT